MNKEVKSSKEILNEQVDNIRLSVDSNAKPLKEEKERDEFTKIKYNTLKEDNTGSDEELNNHSEEVNNSSSKEKLIDEIINRGLTWFQLKLYGITFLHLVSESSELVVISLLLEKLGKIWDLSFFQKGFLGSAAGIGILLGNLIVSKLNNALGRRKTFIIGALISAIACLSSIISSSYNIFAFWRIVFAFGMGISFPSCFALVTEVTPTTLRSWILNFMGLSWSLGQTISIISTAVYIEENEGWRAVLAWVSVPAVLSFVMAFWVQESPRYHLTMCNNQEAFEVINDLLKHPVTDSAIQERQLTETMEKRIIDEEIANKEENLEGSFMALFTPTYIRITLLSAFIYSIINYIFVGIGMILPQLLEQVLKDQYKNENTNSSSKVNATISTINPNPHSYTTELYNSLLIATIAELPARFFSAYLANKKGCGRIRTMAIGFLLTLLANLLVIIDMKNLKFYSTLYKAAAAIVYSLTNLYLTEVFPTNLRVIGMAFAFSFNKFAAILSPLISQWLYHLSIYYPIYSYAVFSILGFLLTILLPFDTQGKEIK